jgi:hypothetical protein
LPGLDHITLGDKHSIDSDAGAHAAADQPVRRLEAGQSVHGRVF